jgi:hypothetical protein
VESRTFIGHGAPNQVAPQGSKAGLTAACAHHSTTERN